MTEYPPDLPDRIVIRDLVESDSLEELTNLLNKAYGSLQRMGLKFLATHQGVDITKRRAESGRCFVMEFSGEIIGTVCYYDPSRGRGFPYYERPDVATLAQMAIKPEVQQMGLATRLVRHVEAKAKEDGAAYLALDTAEPAKHLIAWYERMGYEFVCYQQWPVTNYRSVVMAKRVDARPGS
jgi:predicted N-acetyltransferase YhbS